MQDFERFEVEVKMKTINWLAINKRGDVRIRKTKSNLNWDEIAIMLQLEIPDELFRRPTISAKIEIKDIPNNAYNPEIILNTKELIEQQTGAKIEFTIIKSDEK